MSGLPSVRRFFRKENFRQRSWFGGYVLLGLEKRESAQSPSNAALIAPEWQGVKATLEAYPLDSVAMVGSLIKVGQPVALVRVDNLLYQVKAGSYLGQNYGRITKIAETGITLREIVQDAGGEWIERTATIQLQEVSK